MMQYNNRAILGMIASAINPEQAHYEKRNVSHTVLSGSTLMIYMADGRQFRIMIEEVL